MQKTMKSIRFLLFICLSFINIKIINAEVDCTIYSSTDELDIINLNPFYVRLNPYVETTTAVYDKATQQVRSFTIVNDVNPSLNIYCLKNLQTLQLTNTNLTVLPDIKNFQNLTSLIIRTDNGMINQHLPSEIGQLRSLTILELTDIKNLEDLPNEIEYLTELQSLTLQRIPTFTRLSDKYLGNLTKLQTLILTGLPNLSKLPLTINNFQLLKQFSLSQTNIEFLSLEKLNSLADLSILSNSILTRIEILDMLKLYSLYIQNNNELLSIKLQNLSSLQNIGLSPNKKLISLDMDNLSSIQTISLRDSEQLKTIRMNNLSKLNILELNSLLNFESISFENLPLLSSVSIINSPILKNILFTNTPSIKQLDLSQCQLTSFPKSILTLKSLVSLTMPSNQLSSLPLTFSTDLPNLQILNLVSNKFEGNIFQPPLIYIQELYLNGNLLTTLNGIGQYKSLQRLELKNNQILSIPVEIMKLSSTLQMLILTSNQLSDIPYQMTNMRSLISFYADFNRISSYEQSYLKKLFSTTTIRAYF